MIDLSTPRYSGAEAARACGIPATTFRSYFARGHFRVLGDARERDANGLPHLFSLRDILGLAVALRLMGVANIPTAKAFHLGVLIFAHTGSAAREPGRVFNIFHFGETALLYWPDSGEGRIIPFDKITLSELVNNGTLEKSACVLILNELVAGVYRKLGLNHREAMVGSPAPKNPDVWEEIGEQVSDDHQPGPADFE